MASDARAESPAGGVTPLMILESYAVTFAEINTRPQRSAILASFPWTLIVHPELTSWALSQSSSTSVRVFQHRAGNRPQSPLATISPPSPVCMLTGHRGARNIWRRPFRSSVGISRSRAFSTPLASSL